MDDAAVDGLRVCPGYCGRNLVQSTGNWSECESCHWGERSFNKVACTTCDRPLSAYDWLYLGFMAMLPLLLHSFFIEYCAAKRSQRRTLLLQHACSVFECAASALLAILLVPPVGRPTLLGCGPTELKDWYTMAYNPVINYSYTLRCTQEAVFP
uniref:JNK1/MAPK8-associated membrane protein n=1 Tax=Plectus sambesii TaxID=2011161 RepID=A0A914XBT7_9BILA